MKLVHRHTLNATTFFMIFVAGYILQNFYSFVKNIPEITISNMYVIRDNVDIPPTYSEDGQLIIQSTDKLIIVYETDYFDAGDYTIETMYISPFGGEFQKNAIFSKSRIDVNSVLKNFLVDFDLPRMLKPHCNGYVQGRISYRDKYNVFSMITPQTYTTNKVNICISDT